MACDPIASYTTVSCFSPSVWSKHYAQIRIMVDMVIAQKVENKIRICCRFVVACVFSLCFISCIAEWLFLCSKHKSVTRLGCDSFWVIVVDATSCNGTCGVFVRLSSQLGWIATEFSERLRICCSGPQPDWHSLAHNLAYNLGWRTTSQRLNGHRFKRT